MSAHPDPSPHTQNPPTLTQIRPDMYEHRGYWADPLVRHRPIENPPHRAQRHQAYNDEVSYNEVG
jgi:hypothetical protein